MTVTFQDPICQSPGCTNPTEAYVNVNIACASSVPDRMEARCAEHGGRPFLFQTDTAGTAVVGTPVDRMKDCETCGEGYTTALHFCAPQDAHSVKSEAVAAEVAPRAGRPYIEGMKAKYEELGPRFVVQSSRQDVEQLIDYAESLERELAAARAEIGRLAKARAKLAERLRELAEHEHSFWATHRVYSLETCPFMGCKENAYALRLGKPKRRAALARGGGD